MRLVSRLRIELKRALKTLPIACSTALELFPFASSLSYAILK
jgi:hypothetical protein